MELPYVEIQNRDPRWPDPVCKGWMNKFTVTLSKVTWRRRFFILSKYGDLFYFKAETSKEPCKNPVKIKGRKFRTSNVRQNCIEIERSGKPFLFYAEVPTEEEEGGRKRRNPKEVVVEWLEIFSRVGGIEDVGVDLLFDDHLYCKKHLKKISSFRKKHNKERIEQSNSLGAMLLRSKMTEVPKTDFISFSKELFDIPIEEVKIKGLVVDTCDSRSKVMEGQYNETSVFLTLIETKEMKEKERFDRFKAHAEKLKELQHQNILKFYGSTFIHKSRMIGCLFEPYPNGIARKYLETNGHKLSLKDRLEILKNVCSAMSYLEKENIVHGDLSWTSVGIDSKNVAKLTDLGLRAKLSRLRPDHRYLCECRPPEIIKYEFNRKYTSKTDVFSFGVMFYQILTLDFHPYGTDPEFNYEVRVSVDDEYRPKIDEKPEGKDESLNWACDLMKSCWSGGDLEQRPTFERIMELLEENVESMGKE